MDEARVRQAIEARMAVYRAKQAQRDPFAEDMFNRWDLANFAVEVLEWLAAELNIDVTDPAIADTLPKGEDRETGLRAEQG